MSKFMQLTGYTHNSAKTIWNRLKLKMQFHATNGSVPFTKDGDQAAAPIAKKATPRVLKRKKPSEDSDEDDDVGPKDVFRANKGKKRTTIAKDAAESSEEPDMVKAEPAEDDENDTGGGSQAGADGHDEAEVSV